MEGVPGRTKSFALTGGRWKRSWSSATRETEPGGDDRGRQRSVAQLHRRRQRSGGAGTPTGAPTSPSSREEEAAGNTVSRQTEAGPAPSSARPTGVGLSQDGPAPRRTNVGPGSGFRLRIGANGRACGVGTTQVVRSVIERFSGARIVGRLQKSVRSIFPALPRGAERQTEAERDSASRRRALDEGASSESGNKGARSFART